MLTLVQRARIHWAEQRIKLYKTVSHVLPARASGQEASHRARTNARLATFAPLFQPINNRLHVPLVLTALRGPQLRLYALSAPILPVARGLLH